MSTYSYTQSTTFTITDAKHIASLVAADLMRFHSFYKKPDESEIDKFEKELIEYLKADYLNNVTYGLKRNGTWVHPIKYYVEDGELLSGLDTIAGGFRPKSNVADCKFSSYLVGNAKWWQLSQAERDRFKKQLPIHRVAAEEPQLESGRFWTQDKTYGSGGRYVRRHTV